MAFHGFSEKDDGDYDSSDINYRGLWTSKTNDAGVRIIQYSNGKEDEFGYSATDADGHVRYFLTKRKDAAGDYLEFSYSETNDVVYLNSITDADGSDVTFTYTTANGEPRMSGVSDDYGHTVTMAYDNNALLTNITDAENLNTSFEYFADPTLTQLQKVITPYGTNVFSHTISGSVNHGVLVDEKGIAKHFYLYHSDENTGKVPTSYAAYQPSTTNGTEFALANTLDSEDTNKRNTFYWSPRQYGLLSSDFRTDLEGGTLDLSELYSTNYSQARQRHWLKDTVGNLAQTLSFERAPSPDGTTQGQITWYDYSGKPDNETEGAMILPRFTAWKLPGGDSRFFHYLRNDLGHITHAIETYNDADGNLKVRTNLYVYAANNVDLVSVTNAAGVRVAYNLYNDDHQVVTNRNALNEETVYLYDGSQRLVSILHPSGLVTTNIYGTDGFVQETRDVNIRTNFYKWNNALVQVHTNELGLVLTNSYDGLNRLRKVTYPDGTSITNSYENLDLVKVVDRMGFTNRYEFNRLRQMTRSIDALDRTNTYDYCGCGTLDAATDPLNQTMTYTYDLAGRLIYTAYADGYWVSKSYNLMGWLTNVLDAAGDSVTNWYNNQGLLIATSNSMGRLATYEHDILDRVTNAVDANGVTVVTTYDDLDRIRTRTYPDTGVERFGYSARGLVAYTNQLDKITYYGYDEARRKVAETNANNEVTQFRYDPAGSLTNLVDGKNQDTWWNYDLYGRVTNKVDDASTEIFRYTYDLDNRLTNRWSVAKGTTAYAYDPVGNLTNVDYAVSSDLTLTYDPLNRLTNLLDGVGTTAYGYDAAGQLLTEDGPWDQDTVSYGYNNRLRSSLSLLQRNASAWALSYAHDAGKRLTSVVSPAGSFGYSYDPVRLMQVRELSLPNGGSITNAYDSVARLLTTRLNNASGSPLNLHTYQYNVGNQRTKQTRSDGSYVDYTYDGTGQLVSAEATESDTTTSRLHEQLGYGYDDAGNLQYRTNNALVQTFNVNSLNELTTVTRDGTLTVAGTTTSEASSVTVNSLSATLYDDDTFAKAGLSLSDGNNTFTAVAQDSLSRQDSQSITVYLPATASYSYDDNGNLLSDGKRGFEYDDENQLIKVTVTNAWKSEFSYDGKLRRRIRKEYAWQSSAWVQTNEVHYVYDGNLVLQERDGDNLAVVTYTRGKDLSGSLEGAGGIGGLLARTDMPATINPELSTAPHAYYHCDGNGNVTALVATNQLLVARYLYDPYGNTLSASGPMADVNLYRFSSKEWHPNSGLVYYLYRFYDGSLQRWLNRDLIGEEGGVNLYGFVGNDPENAVDPSGLDFGAWPCTNAEWDQCWKKCEAKGPGWICVNCTAFYYRFVTPFGVGCIRAAVCICYHLRFSTRHTY